MQSLKEKRLEEFRKKHCSHLGGLNPWKIKNLKNVTWEDLERIQKDFEEYLSDSIDMAYEEGKKESNCPPHHFIPHKYEGNWGGATRPPNMKCTKCLSTQYF